MEYTTGNAIRIAEQIKKLYNQLYTMDLENKKGPEYNQIIEKLENLINIEQNMYFTFSEEELNFLDDYAFLTLDDKESAEILDEKAYEKAIFYNYKKLLDFRTDFTMPAARIRRNVDFMDELMEFEIENYQPLIMRGIHLCPSNDPVLDPDQQMHFYNLLFNDMLYALTFELFQESSRVSEKDKLDFKYLASFEKTGFENYMVHRKFEVPHNREFITELASIYYDNINYLMIANDLYDDEIDQDVSSFLVENLSTLDNEFILSHLTAYLYLIGPASRDNIKERINDFILKNNLAKTRKVKRILSLFQDDCKVLTKKCKV